MIRFRYRQTAEWKWKLWTVWTRSVRQRIYSNTACKNKVFIFLSWFVLIVLNFFRAPLLPPATVVVICACESIVFQSFVCSFARAICMFFSLLMGTTTVIIMKHQYISNRQPLATHTHTAGGREKPNTILTQQLRFSCAQQQQRTYKPI